MAAFFNERVGFLAPPKAGLRNPTYEVAKLNVIAYSVGCCIIGYMPTDVK
jgi:hypothetical protein